MPDLTIAAAHDDAQSMYDLLVDRYGFERDEIVVMWNKEGTPPSLHPTEANIFREIDSMAQHAHRSSGNFMLYYVGHGKQEDEVVPPGCVGKEDDGKDEYIYTQDGKFIKDDDLKERLVDQLSSQCCLWAIFDCCSSGTVLDLARTINDSKDVCVPPHAGHRSPGFTDGVGAENQDPTVHSSPDDMESERSGVPRRADSKRKRSHSPLSYRHKCLRSNGATSPSSAVPEAEAWGSLFQDRQMDSPIADIVSDVAKPLKRPSIASVVCLSTARDYQKAYTGVQVQDTVTQFLIRYLRDNPHPLLSDVYEAVKYVSVCVFCF
ncbi:hypothetical protein FISHEDRAFT_73524 [Fistulina hepatica ATCC 64428]|uniref:Peptidase C14 caspase domain-containing protein n=1 Tax=Fistulina hepatica ATCC 64428 TaxID=1128425 RepID=A0A0D7AF86_9AGAR|nr:hypothetical protein FISHEDRAFT_73524 [Fistulina hepatica ATCC 64428]